VLRPKWIVVIFGAALGIPPTAASEVAPFYSFNQSPVIQIYGLPAIGRAEMLARASTRVELNEIIANNFTGAPLANETLLFDGESYRTTLGIAHGLAHGLEVGVEFPYISIRGGHLDSFIEGFHDLFGFDDGGRTTVPRDRLRYFYSRNGTTLLEVSEPASGIGDIRLNGAWQWQAPQTDRGYVAALRGSLKLPTGDAASLLGSGGTDLALWVSLACNAANCSDGWQWFGGFGALYVGNGEVLPELQRDVVGFATVGLGWPWWPAFVLKAQLDGHTPFYRDSDFGQLAGYAAQALLGFTWQLGARTTLDFAFSEDVIENNSSDVTFHIGLRAAF
jgi:hypothetical protein